MKEYLRSNGLQLWFLSLICLLVIVLAVKMVPHGKLCYGGAPLYLNCDYSLWFEATKSFPYAFKFGNILIHRPLFAGIDWLIYKPMRIIVSQSISDVGVFVLTWRLQNIFFYFLLVFLAFEVGRRFWGRRAGFFLGLLVATSNHSYAWLMQPLNNIQGFFITFATWWMGMDFLEERRPRLRLLKLVIYSLSFGFLMLGKAQYNLLGTILIGGLLIEKKLRRETIVFFLIQLVPLVSWLIFINLFLKTPYRNYEARFGIFYFIGEYFKNTSGVLDFWNRLEAIPETVLEMLSKSLGWLATVLGLWYLGGVATKKEGLLWLVYLLMTTGLLFSSSFLLNRHAPDYWPLFYGGTAYWLARATEAENKYKEIVSISIMVGIVLLMAVSLNPAAMEAARIF